MFKKCEELLSLARKTLGPGEPYFPPWRSIPIPLEELPPSVRELKLPQVPEYIGQGEEGFALRYRDENQKHWDLKAFKAGSERDAAATAARSFSRLANMLEDSEDLYELPDWEILGGIALRWPSVIGAPLSYVIENGAFISPYVRTAVRLLHESRSKEWSRRLEARSHPDAVNTVGNGVDLLSRQTRRNWGFVGPDNVIVDPLTLRFTIIDPH